MEQGWRSGPRLPGAALLESEPADASELVEKLVEMFAENDEDEAVIREITASLQRARRQTLPTPIADPAKGAKVPRCRECGLPGPADIVGVRKGEQGRFPVCDRCWMLANPRTPDPDPRYVPEDYAA